MLQAFSAVLGFALAVNREPCPSDLWHFPSRFACVLALECSHACWEGLRAEGEMQPARQLFFQQAEAELQQRMAAWRLLKRCWEVPPDRKGSELAQLRDALGGWAYYEGLMPEPFLAAGK